MGGIPELVVHGETGLLTAPRDAGAFADALNELLQNPKQASAMGRAARVRVKAKFSLAKQVNELLAVWTEVLASSRSPAKESKVKVSDSFNAASDPDLPTVALALNADVVNDEFRHSLERVAGAGGGGGASRCAASRSRATSRASAR